MTFSLTFDGITDFMAGPLMKKVLRTREDRYLANIKWLDEDLDEKLEDRYLSNIKWLDEDLGEKLEDRYLDNIKWLDEDLGEKLEDRYLANIKWLDEDLGEKMEDLSAIKIQKFYRQKLARRWLPQEIVEAEDGYYSDDSIGFDEDAGLVSGPERESEEVLGPFVVRLTPENVSSYIGMEIQFGTRGGLATGFINSVSKSGKTIQIDHPDLNNSLQIVPRRILVRAHTARSLGVS
jgi:hypothetical protein